MKTATRWLTLVAAMLMLGGCGTLEPDGAYKGDKFLFYADDTIINSYFTIHNFVKWELENRETLKKWPEITKFADTLRANSKKWFKTAFNLREAYSISPTPDNRDALQRAIDVIKTAVTEAAKNMAKTAT